MNTLWWSWILSNAVVVVATIYATLVRGRPDNPLFHLQHLSRYTVAAASMFAVARAVAVGPTYLPPEIHAMAIALAVLMVTRAIRETRRYQRQSETAPCR